MGLHWLLFSFRGRINRQPYWVCEVVACIYVLGMEWIIDSEPSSGAIQWAALVFLLPALWAGLAVQAKRWHDTDRSAWWILFNFVPCVGALWTLVVCGFFRGTSGENRFGPDPLGFNPGRGMKTPLSPIGRY